MDTFDLKKFLIENKLTEARLLPKNTGVANKRGIDTFDSNSDVTIKWNTTSFDPQGIITTFEGNENKGTVSKKEMLDVFGKFPHLFQPMYGTKDKKNVWTFAFKSDLDDLKFKGFNEIEDFTFV
jgi:hypothetical protein